MSAYLEWICDCSVSIGNELLFPSNSPGLCFPSRTRATTYGCYWEVFLFLSVRYNLLAAFIIAWSISTRLKNSLEGVSYLRRLTQIYIPHPCLWLPSVLSLNYLRCLYYTTKNSPKGASCRTLRWLFTSALDLLAGTISNRSVVSLRSRVRIRPVTW